MTLGTVCSDAGGSECGGQEREEAIYAREYSPAAGPRRMSSYLQIRSDSGEGHWPHREGEWCTRGRAMTTAHGSRLTDRNRDGVGGPGLAGTREQRDRIRSEPAQTAPGPMIRYVVAGASGVRNNWRSGLCHWQNKGPPWPRLVWPRSHLQPPL